MRPTERAKEREVVVADDRREAVTAGAREVDQPVEERAYGGPVVDVVAERAEAIRVAERAVEVREQRVEVREVAVEVGDDDPRLLGAIWVFVARSHCFERRPFVGRVRTSRTATGRVRPVEPRSGAARDAADLGREARVVAVTGSARQGVSSTATR